MRGYDAFQCLVGIVANAVKFTPSGGHIRVTASQLPDGLAIAVADTGIGIAAKDIPKAFERFGQVDSRLARQYEGVGLGLPLARRLMEMHGGSLEIASLFGVGTTVRLRLPAERVIELAACSVLTNGPKYKERIPRKLLAVAA